MVLHGYDAIKAAKQLNLPLGKYSEDSNRGFRLDLSIEEANALAFEDQNLIFLDLGINRLGTDELTDLAVSLGGKPGQSFNELRAIFEREGDDDRAEIFKAMENRWSELRTMSH